jgi:hypothetical protein
MQQSLNEVENPRHKNIRKPLGNPDTQIADRLSKTEIVLTLPATNPVFNKDKNQKKWNCKCKQIKIHGIEI